MAAVSWQTELKEHFGFTDFQAGQLSALEHIEQNHDQVVVLPTGAGKSLIYQLASQVIPGLTVVVTPLIALMTDQLANIDMAKFRAAGLSSHTSSRETEQILSAIADGSLRLLYVTPERFGNASFKRVLKQANVSPFVIDEAHCISEWGHDFRPAYRKLDKQIELLGHPPVLALTATASPYVRNDIIEHLGLQSPKVVVHGIDRPELYFSVGHVDREAEDLSVLGGLFNAHTGIQGMPKRTLKKHLKGSGIIYTATTEKAEETAAWLRKNGYSAGHYHGQQSKTERQAAQAAFISDDIQIICATNAFGMGIDKPDVRFVIHRDIPGSIEEYYQEAGRAGRDGEPALCHIIYDPADLRAATYKSGTKDTDRKQYEQGRLAAMQTYATLKTCRRHYLLNYFTEPYGATTCNNCDNDTNPSVVEKLQAALYASGDAVRHKEWGDGIVQTSDIDTVTILFATVGSKRLSLKLISESELLQAI